MNVQDAAYITGHDYPGGSVALAPRMGMSSSILSNKLNPNISTHHLTLAEAMRLMALTGDHRMLVAMASELGYMVKPIEAAADEGPMHAVTHTIAEFGQLVTAVTDAIDDGKVTLLEQRRIDKELEDLIIQASKLSVLVNEKLRA